MTQPKYTSPEAIKITNRQWPDRVLNTPPVWASVDLRDGNQALPIPMNPQQKLEYFKMLCGIGFKEIEISFPSASEDDFNFVRMLIEGDLIPDDVRISVLTQAREHLIKRTIESLSGLKGKAILHCYVATSDLHSKFVLGDNREHITELAVQGTRLIREGLAAAGLIVLLVWLIVRHSRRNNPEYIQKDPPHIVALRKLDKFRGNAMWVPEKQKTFYSGITDALREYISDRYGIGAMEMTTAEIFEDMKATDVPAELLAELKELFERADFVKFAMFVASDEDNAAALPLAVRFVTSTYQIDVETCKDENKGGE